MIDFAICPETVLAASLVSMSLLTHLKLDEKFLDHCRGHHEPILTPSSLILSAETPVSPKPNRLREKYLYAYSDFRGCGSPCIFKSGPSWPPGKDNWAIYREARPVYDHPIQPVWLDIGAKICQALDSKAIKWTSIGPRAYANEGESRAFCPIILRISVVPRSLLYDDAVAAAALVKGILAEASFSDIEVAFVESLVTRSAGHPLLSFQNCLENMRSELKPFTPTLGLAIAPSQYPYYEGTASLYFRLSKDSNRTIILTCAHVARPPPLCLNTSLSENGHNEEIVALGTSAYNTAVKSVMDIIGDRLWRIAGWSGSIQELGDPVEGEDHEVTDARNHYLHRVKRATCELQTANEIHNRVTKRFATTGQRIIGRIFHSEKIPVSVEPYKYAEDWALIEVYDDKINWDTFEGNKVFVGDNLSMSDYRDCMFPHVDDRKDHIYPLEGLLQASGVVQDSEIRKPKYRDANGNRILPVVKNGAVTGTTIGCVNGLESFTRIYDQFGNCHTSIQIAVLRSKSPNDKFSDSGDSGSVVLDREGRIVGILTSCEGPEYWADTTYLTPYWWLEQQIKAKFPDITLYEVIDKWGVLGGGESYAQR